MLNFLNKKWRFIVPVLFVEMYLIFTVYLLYFGPLDWNLTNNGELVSYLVLYHLSFIFGYVLFFYQKRNKGIEEAGRCFDMDSFIVNNYGLILFFAFLGSVISYKNMTFGSSLIPESFFSDLYIGLVEPRSARANYAININNMASFGNPYISSLLLFFAPFKYILLPSLVYFWTRLRFWHKFFGFLICMIPLLGGIVTSISAINFSYFFIILITFFVIVLQQNTIKSVKAELKKRTFILSFLFVISIFSFYQFYAVKSGANLYQLAIENVEIERFDYLEKNGIIFKLDSSEDRTFLYDFYEKLTIYLVQGYKGMSISLDYPFDSTYGVGHSIFLQRVFEDYLGFNIREHTFQRKINNLWDENVYWHSAYSYFANDVGFFGVILIMFFLGYCFSFVIYRIVQYNEITSKLLLPLFAIMFLYLPANNQVFSFLEYMIPFWFLLFVIIISAYVYKKHKIQVVSEKIC
ncbi:O-antigen polymerase [Aliivibrio fischeri]|uniref:Oligosaccharide repeat unit polymerase n=1 Tax=Aliivibrio fischeri TaxID=668 RepID=A0A844P0Z0_ALIFS|nr:O-antigen polymerase [Aliivibrio fischeri]MUK49010.1 hypothetical protein [Aliivibrio fischeri]